MRIPDTATHWLATSDGQGVAMFYRLHNDHWQYEADSGEWRDSRHSTDGHEFTDLIPLDVLQTIQMVRHSKLTLTTTHDDHSNYSHDHRRVHGRPGDICPDIARTRAASGDQKAPRF